VKTENGRGRGGGGQSLLQQIIELAKKIEEPALTPELRERVLARARKQVEVWQREAQAAGTGAHRQAARRSAPREASQPARRSGRGPGRRQPAAVDSSPATSGAGRGRRYLNSVDQLFDGAFEVSATDASAAVLG